MKDQPAICGNQYFILDDNNNCYCSKCDLVWGGSYSSDIYRVVAASSQIKSEIQQSQIDSCFQTCLDNPMCKAFQFDTVDSTALTNCKIHTSSDIKGGNGYKQGLCFLKDVSTTVQTTYSALPAIDNNLPSVNTVKTNNPCDYACKKCNTPTVVATTTTVAATTTTVAAATTTVVPAIIKECTTCEDGFFVVFGFCIRSIAN